MERTLSRLHRGDQNDAWYRYVKLSSDVKGDCGRWLCTYPSSITEPGIGFDPGTPPGECAAWQYASDGRVSGIGGNCDMNVFYGDRNAWSAYAGSTSGRAWVQDAHGWWYKRRDSSWPASPWLQLDARYWFDADGCAVSG